MGLKQQAALQFQLKTLHNHRSILLDSRVFPVYAVGCSIILLALHGIILSKPIQKLRARLTSYDPEAEGEHVQFSSGVGWQQRLQKHIVDIGGTEIFGFKFLRLNVALALFGVTLFPSLKGGLTWIDLIPVLTTGYAAVLALLNVLALSATGRVMSLHLTLVTFTLFAVYAYRDIWPLMTFTLDPADKAEGSALWVKVAFVTFVGAIEPMFEPYVYIPEVPQSPSAMVNPEQTASIFSFLLYTFLDPTIWLAIRLRNLSLDQLPPLCDYDSVKNLIKRSYARLDPFSGAKRGNLFFGFVKIFNVSLFYQTVLLIIMAVTTLASPIGTNRLLNYLEQDRDGAVVRPWVWIVCLTAGPWINNVFFQLYLFFSTRTEVRVQGIITSLVFDHALRIRLKAEISDKERSSMTNPITSDTPSSSGGGNEMEDSTTAHLLDISTSTSTTAVVSQEVDHTKAATFEVKKEDAESEAKAAGDNLVGKLNNLVTSDLNNISKGCDFLLVVVSAPLQIALAMWFLHRVLGWSAFIGLAVMLLLLPLPAWVASLMNEVQQQQMKSTDARVQSVTEMMGVLRMIKLFGWEARVKGAASAKREEELRWLFTNKMFRMLINIIGHVIPLFQMAATYATYTLIMKKDLNASIVFSSMSAFDVLRTQIFTLFGMGPWMITAKVSLGRVAEFLQNTELLDTFTERPTDNINTSDSEAHKDDIGCGNAHFTWTNGPADGGITPSKRTFRLRIEDELVFKKGKFNLIVGPTGVGKTSLLMALLGEMHYIPLGPNSWTNLPREGGVAFVAQESWIQSETIRDNILFGAPYNEERYKKVIYQCGLKRDLSLFKAGDATEIGEKGLTLSGGQKARITLARAVYSSAEILLLDDVLAALDVQTSRWIVDKCFQGDLIYGRTVLLVTHNLAMASPLADFVVSIGADGQLLSQGSIDAALAKDKKLAEEFKTEETIELKENKYEDEVLEAKDGKLIATEEVEEGHVSMGAFMLFLRALGGKWPSIFWLQYLSGDIMVGVCDAFQMWWLGWWAQQYDITSQGGVSVGYYLAVYGLIILAMAFFYISACVIWAYGSMRASRSIHHQLLTTLLGSTFRWLDVTPTSRVIARCTQDIQAVDEEVAQNLVFLSELTLSMIAKLGAVIIYTPTFLLPGVVIAALGGYLGQLYIKTQLLVKREMSNAKSPVLGILGETMAGLTSIRAYGAQQTFKEETLKRIDRYICASRSFYNLNRWISIRVDALSSVFVAALALYLVYGRESTDPSSVGFVLAMAVSFTNLIIWWIRSYNDFEVSGNSLERIQQYLVIDQEPGQQDRGMPPAVWPSSGEVRVENLSARYSPNGPTILENISFHIKAGQRVGIVGRTGSGKSTLTLALLRCIYTEGTVWYDGIPTHTVNLDALRSNITIIPQVPELLSGTLRQNLDMFNQYDDAALNDALRAAGLFSLQHLHNENRLTLDSKIASAGGNLSVGQRQIIALARAIVRQSKLLILDEATSAIDYETDSVIQSSLRNELSNDVTVITVAHRLRTIMDSDKIMVLDAGRLVEFNSPEVLLRDKESLLRALVEESADRDELLAMAQGGIII